MKGDEEDLRVSALSPRITISFFIRKNMCIFLNRKLHVIRKDTSIDFF